MDRIIIIIIKFEWPDFLVEYIKKKKGTIKSIGFWSASGKKKHFFSK